MSEKLKIKKKMVTDCAVATRNSIIYKTQEIGCDWDIDDTRAANSQTLSLDY